MVETVFSARPPADAVAYMRDKTVGGRFSFDWRDVWQEEHLTSFVVAKMTAADLLADVHQGVLDAIEQGWTRRMFIDRLRPLLEERGWWGVKEQLDPVTGRMRPVRLGSPRRLGIIYDTNMRMAHAAGRWQRFEAAKGALPYLVYTAVQDERTRHDHARWGGRGAPRVVLPIDHPFWRTHYPPNGWRCRCIVMAANAAMLEGWGLKVTTEAELEALDWKKTRPWLNKRTGRTEAVPAGIDPGFAYNVGQARRAALTPPPVPPPQRAAVIGDRYPAELPPRPRPRKLPRGVARRPGLEGGAVFDAFARTLGVAEGGVFFDAAQIPLVIDRRLFQQRDAAGALVAAKADKAGRGEWAEVLAATLRDPDEIWMSVQRQADGRTRLTRNYLAAWHDPDGERLWFFVSFAGLDGWWSGVTAFAPGKRGKLERQARYADESGRVGTLVYRRR